MANNTDHSTSTDTQHALSVSRRSFLRVAVGSLVALPSVTGGFLLPMTDDLGPTEARAETPVTQAEAKIVVAKAYEVGFFVVDLSDAKRRPLVGAQVTVRSLYNSVTFSGKTDRNGVLLVDTRMLGAKETVNGVDRYSFYAQVDVEASGYRKFRTRRMKLEGAKGFQVPTSKLKGETVYPLSVSFDDWDILYTTNEFCVTTANDAKHPFVVELVCNDNRAVEISLCQGIEKRVIERRRATPDKGIATFSFSDYYLLKDHRKALGIGVDYFLRYSLGSKSYEVPLKLSCVAAATGVSAPSSTNFTLSPFGTGAMKPQMEVPKWVPILGGTNINVWTPDLPVEVMFNPFGYFKIAYKSEEKGYKSKNGKYEGDAWKSHPRKSFEDQVNAAVKEREDMMKKVGQAMDDRKGFMQKVAYSKAVSATAMLSAVLAGRWDLRGGLWRGQAALVGTLAFNFSYSQQFMAGPVPMVFDFTFLASVSLGVEVAVSTPEIFTASKYSLDYTNTGVSLTVTIQPTVSLGVGVKGVLSASLQGLFALTIFVHCGPLPKNTGVQKFSNPHVVLGVKAQLNVVLQALIFTTTYTILEKNEPACVDNWKPKLAAQADDFDPLTAAAEQEYETILGGTADNPYEIVTEESIGEVTEYEVGDWEVSDGTGWQSYYDEEIADTSSGGVDWIVWDGSTPSSIDPEVNWDRYLKFEDPDEDGEYEGFVFDGGYNWISDLVDEGDAEAQALAAQGTTEAASEGVAANAPISPLAGGITTKVEERMTDDGMPYTATVISWGAAPDAAAENLEAQGSEDATASENAQAQAAEGTDRQQGAQGESPLDENGQSETSAASTTSAAASAAQTPAPEGEDPQGIDASSALAAGAVASASSAALQEETARVASADSAAAAEPIEGQAVTTGAVPGSEDGSMAPAQADAASTAPDAARTSADAVSTSPDATSTAPDAASAAPDAASTGDAGTAPDAAGTAPDAASTAPDAAPAEPAAQAEAEEAALTAQETSNSPTRRKVYRASVQRTTAAAREEGAKPPVRPSAQGGSIVKTAIGHGLVPGCDKKLMSAVFSDPRTKVVKIFNDTFVFRIASVKVKGKMRTRVVGQRFMPDGKADCERVYDFTPQIDPNSPAVKTLNRDDLFDYDFDVTTGPYFTRLRVEVCNVHLFIISGRRPNGDQTKMGEAASDQFFTYGRCCVMEGTNGPAGSGLEMAVTSCVNDRRFTVTGKQCTYHNFSCPHIEYVTDTYKEMSTHFASEEASGCIITYLDRGASTPEGVLKADDSSVSTGVGFCLAPRDASKGFTVIDTKQLVGQTIDDRSIFHMITLDRISVPAKGKGQSSGWTVVTLRGKDKTYHYAIQATLAGEIQNKGRGWSEYFLPSLMGIKSLDTTMKNSAGGTSTPTRLVKWPRHQALLASVDGKLMRATLKDTNTQKPRLAYEECGPAGFSISNFDCDLTGTFIYWPTTADGSPGFDYSGAPDDPTQAKDLPKVKYHQVMASRIRGNRFSSPFVFSEVGHDMDIMNVVGSQASEAMAFVSCAITDAKKAQADLWYTSMPNVRCANVVGVECLSPVVFPGADATFNVTVRNDGNTYLAGFTAVLREKGAGDASTAKITFSEKTLVSSNYTPKENGKFTDVEPDWSLAPGKTAVYQVKLGIPSGWTGEKQIAIRGKDAWVAAPIKAQGLLDALAEESDGLIYDSEPYVEFDDSDAIEYLVGENGDPNDYDEGTEPFDIVNIWYEDDLSVNDDGYDDTIADAPIEELGDVVDDGNEPVVASEQLPRTGDETLGTLPLALAAAGAGMVAYSRRRTRIEQDVETERDA